MKVKSNIKSKKFYAEANDLSEGWGDSLLWIDKLKDKIQFHKEIALNEFCWSLFGDGYTSHCWEAFQKYCKTPLKISNKKMLYDAWRGIFDKWVNTIYDWRKNY